MCIRKGLTTYWKMYVLYFEESVVDMAKLLVPMKGLPMLFPLSSTLSPYAKAHPKKKYLHAQAASHHTQAGSHGTATCCSCDVSSDVAFSSAGPKKPETALQSSDSPNAAESCIHDVLERHRLGALCPHCANGQLHSLRCVNMRTSL